MTEDAENKKNDTPKAENGKKVTKNENFSPSAKNGPMSQKMVVAPGSGAWTRRCLDKGGGYLVSKKALIDTIINNYRIGTSPVALLQRHPNPDT